MIELSINFPCLFIPKEDIYLCCSCMYINIIVLLTKFGVESYRDSQFSVISPILTHLLRVIVNIEVIFRWFMFLDSISQ